MAANPRKKPAPKSPAPLTLKGSKLEDFLPLIPAEEKLRQCAANGEECIVDDFSGKRPKEATKLNTVRAEFLRYMILGGCEKSPVDSVGINLYGAYIDCTNNEENIFYLQAITIEHNVCIIDSIIAGNLFLQDAQTRTIDLSGCAVNSIIADGISSSGSIRLRDNFVAISDIQLLGAIIHGDLSFRNSTLNGNLVCDAITVNGNIYLDLGFCVTGLVRLMGAAVKNDIACVDGNFSELIIFDNSNINGNLLLHGSFTAAKTIHLRNAKISGNVHCKDGTFNEANIALIANRAKIDGDVDLENVTAKGTIALTGTEIGGDFTPQGATLEGTPALQLRNSKIGGTLVWRSLKHVNGEVDFSGASCATINTDGDTWMRKREAYHEKRAKGDASPVEAETKQVEYTTKLDNFTYGGFSNLPDNCKPAFWVEFLNQQPQDHLEKNFKPRPWEQLASVLDTMGYEEEALELRIEKQKLQTSFMASHEPAAQSGLNLWHWGNVFFRKLLWGPLVGYGYKPGNALVYLFGLIVLGSILYDQAAKRGIMTPTHPLIFKEAREGGSIPAWCAENWVYFPDKNCNAAMPSEYSEFQSFIYAADVALPVVNLRMEVDWAPRVVFTDGTPDRFGWWVRFYEWILIASGWILSLLFVSAVGSSIRK